MIIKTNIVGVRKIISNIKLKGKTIGFVPTMGALHEGHMSLVAKAARECDFVVVSVFVNPLQFGPREDLSRYPRNFAKDKRLLRKAGVDLLFCPQSGELYPAEFSTYVEEKEISKVLCGRSRPEHFKGVCTILTKLFNIVNPDVAYFGQKDYQQALIVKKLVQDLNFPLKIKIAPLIRDKNNLALSSRNSYLNKGERQDSACIYAALSQAKDLINKGEKRIPEIIKAISKVVKDKKTTKIDYIEIRDTDTLKPLKKITGKILIAMAVYVGRTRLIDNIILNVKK